MYADESVITQMYEAVDGTQGSHFVYGDIMRISPEEGHESSTDMKGDVNGAIMVSASSSGNTSRGGRGSQNRYDQCRGIFPL